MQDLQLHLAQVIGNTLDFNQLRAGRLSIHLEPLELTEFIQNAVDAFKATCDAKGLELLCDYPDRLQGVFISSDGLRLRQVLFNLISNSVKYTKQGKIRIEFDLIENKPNPHILQISVFDTGIGIPKHKLSKVFQEYSQVHSDNTYAENSTGLGLSLVQELVSALSGSCGVNSTEGIGSHFWCRISVEKLAIDALPKSTSNCHEVKQPGKAPTTYSNTKPELHHLTILVAEDESINRKVIGRILRKYGVNVLEACDGPSAVEAARDEAHSIDMFLVELHIPGLNGLEVMQQIRQVSRYQKTPAICISGALIESDEDHPVSRGFDEFVCKPINPEALISKICYYSLLQVVSNAK